MILDPGLTEPAGEPDAARLERIFIIMSGFMDFWRNRSRLFFKNGETESAADESAVIESEESKIEKIKEQKMKAEDMKTEEFKTEDIKVEKAAEEAAANKTAIEKTAAEKTAAEETAAKETAIEKAATEVKTAENSSAQQTGAKKEPETAASASGQDQIPDPEEVFKHFYAISAIPHGSFFTKELSDYLENFASENGLACMRDEAGNLIISRPGSKGYENAEPLALQGHIDMVLEKEASNSINMEKEPITLIRDGDWLRADRTTLGGDDGIAVAMMMALLTDKTIQCPPLECIFTVDEEVGLRGAYALDLSGLKSRRMINLDSEEEGVITSACAGGVQMICTLPGIRREKKGRPMEITISGLLGGHSGEMIGKGRANADRLLARLLYRLDKEAKYYLISFNGGKKDNAIPREAKAEILFAGNVSKKDIRETVRTFANDIAKEYSVTDPDIEITTRWMDKDGEKEDKYIVFRRKDTRRMVRFLMALPNGVIRFSPLFKDIPRTSLNLGIVKTMADGMYTDSLLRSSLDSQKQMLVNRILCIAEEFGIDAKTDGSYPAWELVEKSQFREMAAEVYRRVTGKEAKVQVTHGGLECGILAAKVPGLECISIGPDMEEIHTPAERLSIPSCQRTWEYVKELVAACAKA